MSVVEIPPKRVRMKREMPADIPRLFTSGSFVCERKGRLFRGCKFEARYSKHDNSSRYIGDICVRCGQVVRVGV